MTNDVLRLAFDTSNEMKQHKKSGLLVCKQICNSLEGDITVNSKPNVGSKVKFTMHVFREVNL